MPSYWDAFHCSSNKHSQLYTNSITDTDTGDQLRIKTRSSGGKFAIFVSEESVISLWYSKEDVEWTKIQNQSLDILFRLGSFNLIHIHDIHTEADDKVCKIVLSCIEMPGDLPTKFAKAFLDLNTETMHIDELRFNFSAVNVKNLNEMDIINVRNIKAKIEDENNEIECVKLLNVESLFGINGHFITKPRNTDVVNPGIPQVIQKKRKSDGVFMKRGRPVGMKDSSKRSRGKNISASTKAVSMLNLAQILTIEKQSCKWSIDENVHALFTLTQGYDLWLAERGSDSLSKKLNDWLREIRQEFESKSDDTKKIRCVQFESMIQEYTEWKRAGCIINFFELEKNYIKDVGNTTEWYNEQKEFLLMIGRKKLSMMKLDCDHTLECVSAHTQPETKNSIQVIVDHHAYELQFIKTQWLRKDDLSTTTIRSIKEIFESYDMVLKEFLRYGFMIETFLNTLLDMRSKRKQIYVQTLKLMDNITSEELSSQQVSSLMKNMIPNISGQIWNKADSRLYSMLPPHVYASLHDFLQNDNSSSIVLNQHLGLSK